MKARHKLTDGKTCRRREETYRQTQDKHGGTKDTYERKTHTQTVTDELKTNAFKRKT
jgi:hypothetical protein